ncbi:MAG TPA: hypothetical protein VGH73_09735 [Thermoanaerobaculia bacterium]
MPITPGRVAWYVTGRFYEDQQGRLQDVGYFLHLTGVQGALFDGSPGEASARVTFRSAPFQATTVTNGNLSVGLDAVGDFSVYLNDAGGASFDDPASFSRGRCVATFRRASVVMGETISSPLPGGLAISTNVFSADLVASAPFEIHGIRHDFHEMLPHGLTQWGTASANPLAAVPPFARVVAFTGSAVAAG